jgi:uncharacterized integral membrane protein
MYFFLLLALIIAIVLVLFAIQNPIVVTVSFFSWQMDGSLVFILVTVFAAGLLTGVLMSLPSLFRKSFALREKKRKIKDLEKHMIEDSPVSSEVPEKQESDSDTVQ